MVFDSDSSYVEDKETGEWTEMVRKDGLMVMKMWVRRAARDEVPF